VETAGGFGVEGQQDIPTGSPHDRRTNWVRIEGVLSADHTMLISLTAAYGSIFEEGDFRWVETNKITLREVPLTLSSNAGLSIELGPSDLQRYLVSYSYHYTDEKRPGWILVSRTEKDIDFTSDVNHLTITLAVGQ
jgi:hypothetical protein